MAKKNRLATSVMAEYRQLQRKIARSAKNAKITSGTVKAIKYGGIFALGAVVAHSLSKR